MNSNTISNAAAASTHMGSFKVHVPFPQELGIECEKAREILVDFTKSFTGETADHNPVPPHAFVKAKGIVVISVLKVGAGWSGRIGSGLVIAKLADGRWSAPSAVVLFGAGYGPQFGASITDFVYVLTSDSAMNTFLQTGQLTLGAQFSLTAGQTSKGMESSAFITQGQAPVAPGYCYAKSKGFFIGVSLEGSVISTRKDANERFYHNKTLTQAQLLGSVLEPAAAAESLYAALDETHRIAVEKIQNDASEALSSVTPFASSSKMPVAPQTKEPFNPVESATPVYTPVAETAGLYPSLPVRQDESPQFEPIAIALYDYEAQRATDLSFKKGDVIVIVSRSETQNDWWVGRLNGQEGRFPANRVKVETK